MAVDGMGFLVQLRKLAIRTIRASSRSVRNHPLLVGALLFVIFLYRSSPFLFSLLVSASPVLVCTAVLLGTLLSFGNPQIPEFDKDEKISCESSSLRTAAVPNSSTVFQKEADKDVGDSAFLGDVCSVSRFEGSLLTPQNSREIVFEQRSVEEENDECRSREVEFTREDDEEMMGFEGDHGHIDDHFEGTTLTFEGSATDYEVQEKGFENEGSREGSDDGNVGDFVESSSVPWTRMNGDHGDDEDEEEDEDEDSGSDGAESSSPDPSMADIIPLLDELHPLIECENLIPDNLSREDSSGLPRNGSHSSHVSSIDSDEETDLKSAEEGEEAGDDDDEEENRGDKEDAEKSAITWTEDDQKNLMDLGSSEMERNQRLESLIARRRARRSMRMTTERNLIDLDDLVLPFQVAPISTTRQNPFDFPNDTLDNMDLPPIPGSAPSIMLQRRNPFDIPYDSGEEKPDLMGDSFQQEFMPPIQKEPVFRRHESFHIGSSIFEFPRLEARDSHRTSRFRPYFIPERLASEGGSSFSSFSEASSFQRQTSELSGSLSFHRQTSGISETSSFQRQLSDLSESKASSAAETEPVSAELDQEEMKVGDHDSTEERTLDPEIDHASEHVEHGSQLSENFDDQIEKRDFDLHMPEIILGESETYIGSEFHQHEQELGVEINLGSSGNDHDVDSWVSEARDLVASAAIIESSISSEHNDVKEADEGLVKGDEMGFHFIENSDVQSENLFNTSDFHHHHRHTHSAERSAFETSLTLETIEEEHIISPSSSLTSEERIITEGLKPDDALMYKEHIRPDDNNSDFPTEQALDSLNFSFSMDLEESHIKDPVYDLSPQASKINLSISSEELADLENKDLKLEQDGFLQENGGEDDAKVDQEDTIISVIAGRRADAKAEHSSAHADFFSIADVSTEEPELVNEDVLLADETNFYPANAVDVSGNFKEQLISVAEEGESVEDHCLINSPPFHYEEDPFVIPEKLEGVSSEIILHSKVYPEMNDLLSPPLQTVGTSSVFRELAQEPVSDFIDFSEPVEGGDEFEFESSIFGDRNTPFTDSSVPQSDIIREMDEALLSELDVVGDFHVTELGMPSTQETLEAENIEAGINELQETHMSEAKIQFQSVENIEKSGDDDTRKSSPDVFINESQPEVQNAEVFMDEFSYSSVLEGETIENVKQFSDEDAEKSASEVLFINTYEPKVEDAETGMAEILESHVLESTTMSYIPEPEYSQSDENAEIFGTVEGTEVDLLGGFELDIKTDDPVTILGDTSEVEKELVVETNESVPSMLEEIERSIIAANDVSFDSCILESDTSIEKDELAIEVNESVYAVEEEIERSTVAAIDVSLDSHVLESDTVIEKNEPAAEVNESVYSVEEEIERSAIDTSFNALIEKDERPAAEINDTDPPMEAEIERSATDASFDDLIEKDEQPAAETNDTDPPMEEEIERSAIDASFDDLIETDEQPAAETNDTDPTMEEEIERSAIVACFDAVIEKDEQPAAETNDTYPAMEEEIEWCVIDASSDSHVSTNEALIEKDEQSGAGTDDTILFITQEIERSATDAFSDSHFAENDAQIEKDVQPAAQTNESDRAMDEEIERSSFEASSDSHVPEKDALIKNAETNEAAPAMEEEIEGSANAGIDASSDSHLSKNDAQIEKDEQPAAEINESVTAIEEEIERSSVDDSSDSHVPKNKALIENAEANEPAPAMEEEREGSVAADAGIDASSDFHILENDAEIEKDEQPAAETNESVPAMEEEMGRSAIDAFTDAQVSENNALIENAETNESALAMEEEKGIVNAGIDTSSDSRVSNSETVIEKDVPALGDESQDAQEVGNPEAECFPDVTIRQFESEQLTSAQTPSLQLESAESQALQEEDHQTGQTQLSVGHLETSTENVSVTEKSFGQGSSDAAPEMPKREEE